MIRILLALFFLFSSSFFSDAQSVKDSLIQIVEESRNDTSRIDAFIKLANYTRNQGEYRTSIGYAEEALKLSEELKFKKGKAGALNSLGTNYFYMADYPNALRQFFESLKILEELGDEKGMGSSFNNIGNIYNDLSDYKNALEYYTKSLKYNKESGYTMGVANNFYNIANVYENTNDHSKSFEFYYKSLISRMTLNDIEAVVASYTGLAGAYFNLHISDSLKNGVTLNYNGKLKNLSNSILLDSAEFYYNKAYTEAKELKLDFDYLISLNGKAEILDIKGNTEEARSLYLQAFNLAVEMESPQEQSIAARGLYHLNKRTRKFPDALKWYEIYNRIQHQIFTEEKHMEMGKQEARFEFEKREQLAKAEHLRKQELAKEEVRSARLKMVFFAAAGFLLMILVVVVLRGYRQKRKDNLVITQQKLIVEEKNKEILDSIHYAKRIQLALLKDIEHINTYLPEHFILFKPKDIVSGDFYWSYRRDNLWYIGAFDCTGHGVPGAFLTMLGTAFLNEITSASVLKSPADILNELRNKIILELSSQGKSKDGMDASLACLDIQSGILQWSGAYNPLWIERSNEIIVYKGTKQPVGYYPDPKPFEHHAIQLIPGDVFYLFTDGFADQFGGDAGKKLKQSSLKNYLLEMNSDSMELRKSRLNDIFETWKGNHEQVDDVCIIGVKYAGIKGSDIS